MRNILHSLKYRVKRRLLIEHGRYQSRHIPIKKMENPIDFVVTWVDGNDPVWLAEKERYEQAMGIHTKHTDNGEERYRDWDIFQYWFRAVETYAPWVQTIYLVTCGQIPAWLNLDAPKLKVVKHTDFIPEKYLPTFNSNAIEMNFHRIEGLSEHFVYFNDDVFLNRPVEPEDFFRGGLPNYTALAIPLKNEGNSAFYHMLFTALGIINQVFRGKISQTIRENPEKWFSEEYGDLMRHNIYAMDENFIPGMCFPHLGVSWRKSTMEKIWNADPNDMDETCSHRFRSPKDVQNQIISLWEMLDGSFNAVGRDHHGKLFWAPTEQRDEIVDAIIEKKYRMICINDSENVPREGYLSLKKDIREAFERAFPQKSSFEK